MPITSPPKYPKPSIRTLAIQQATITEFSQRALKNDDLSSLMNDLVTLVAQTLNADYCLVVERRAGRARLQLRAGFGLSQALLDQVSFNIDDQSLAGLALRSKEAIVAQDLRAEKKFADPMLFHDARIRSGMSVIIPDQNGAFGAIGVYTSQPRAFMPDDIYFVQALANVLAAFIRHKSSEEKIQRQLDRITGLRSIDVAISDGSDLRKTLDVILNQVVTQLQVDSADVLLLNSQTQLLEYAAGIGFRTRALQQTRLELGSGRAGMAALEARVVSVPDLNVDPGDLRHSHLLSQEGFVTYYGVPLVAKGVVKGVLEIFHRTFLQPDREWMNFLQALAGQAAIAIDSGEMFDSLQRSNFELTMAYDATIMGWSRALDLRDRETEGHTQRVTELTEQLGKAIGLSQTELVHLRRGAMLHDIGKMAIPDSILLKPTSLTSEEWEIMRKHPFIAYELLSPISYLRPVVDIPFCHHEKWDGTGYPRQLAGEQIPLSARLFAIIDVWDALRSDRPYRSAWSPDQVRDYIRSNAGTHFDPKVVPAFLKLVS